MIMNYITIIWLVVLQTLKLAMLLWEDKLAPDNLVLNGSIHPKQSCVSEAKSHKITVAAQC